MKKDKEKDGKQRRKNNKKYNRHEIYKSQSSDLKQCFNYLANLSLHQKFIHCPLERGGEGETKACNKMNQ